MKETAFSTKIRKAQQNEYNRKIGSPFHETLVMFREATGLEADVPLTYEEWMSIPKSLKSAALFVMYYNTITFAYYKARSFYSPEEDNVSIVLQYLEKNVPILEKDRKRYSPKYIYQVAYNCIFCQSRGIKRDVERYESEVSNVVCDGDTELDLFDTVVDKNSIEGEIFRKDFWKVIDSYKEDDMVMAVIDNLINGTRLPAGGKQRKTEIVEMLKDSLSVFVEVTID